ncbi:3-phytase A [Podospora australis]|uniref:3-phytase n=1 Tax=Podospora australis TaxID=1536484 RepID=A0AAN7AK79_9PEZI|nr:3-phytase A [Podospora australis]
MRGPTYAPVHQNEDDNDLELDESPSSSRHLPRIQRKRPVGIYRRDIISFFLSFLVSFPTVILLGVISGNITFAPSDNTAATGQGEKHNNFNNKVKVTGSGGCEPTQTQTVPQYFQTSPELWAGPTATGKVAAFLAQTRAGFGGEGGKSWVPNEPLQTGVPLHDDDGKKGEEKKGIFGMMGYLTPYKPADGFGVDEWPLPDGAEIVQVQMVSRHGSRYPTSEANVGLLGHRIKAAKKAGKFKAKGELEFLNEWEYQLGHEILVSKGRQELFDSGVLHSYMYGKLYNPNSKIIVRTTTQDRMLKSAENFMAGFFGLEWTNNATIEVIIEDAGYNNSLAGYLNCPNGNKVHAGTDAANIWIGSYLQNATDRLSKLIEGYQWTITDTYAAQTMCPYETVAYGYSVWCSLFTYEEWVGFGYSIDLNFYGNDAFGSPVGRAIGIGYQQEVVARLRNHTLGYSGSQINVTLDNNTETFPLDQSLYFDFSHDTNIISILTAFGLTQFAGTLDPHKFPGPHNFTVSELTPFGARLDIEIIRSPRPIFADRSGFLGDGGETKYVHFVLNQRTIPLGWSLPECDAARVDGWCELGAFLHAMDRMEGLAQYEKACHGDEGRAWLDKPYGEVWDGAPPPSV